MREISAISTDLTKLAAEIGAKKKAKADAEYVLTNTSIELDKVNDAANKLRNELDEALNLLVPSSNQGRVRQS